MIYCACFPKAKIRLKAILSPNEKENRAIINGNVLAADFFLLAVVLKNKDNRVS